MGWLEILKHLGGAFSTAGQGLQSHTPITASGMAPAPQQGPAQSQGADAGGVLQQLMKIFGGSKPQTGAVGAGTVSAAPTPYVWE